LGNNGSPVWRHDFKKGYLMLTWFLRQVTELLVRYAVALSVSLVVGSVGHFVIFEAVSGSMFARIMALDLFFLMVPTVIVWHVLCQLQIGLSRSHESAEVGCALAAVVVSLVGVFVVLTEVYSVNMVDIALFVGTFTVAGGLCGYITKWLKIKKWIHSTSYPLKRQYGRA